MTDKASFRLTVYIYLISLVITHVLFPISNNQPEVLGRSYPLAFPDIYANQGGTVTVEGVTAIVEAGTFTKDVYLRVDRTKRINPKSVQGLWPSQTRLWQVSDLWQVRFKTQAADDEVKSADMKKSPIISFPYDTKLLVSDQGVYFPESSLRLALGQTADGPWTILDTIVVDRANHTVSLYTKESGYYMIVGGSQSSDVSNQRSVDSDETQNQKTSRPENQNTKVIYVVVTATPTPVKKSTTQKVNEGIVDSLIRLLNELF